MDKQRETECIEKCNDSGPYLGYSLVTNLRGGKTGLPINAYILEFGTSDEYRLYTFLLSEEVKYELVNYTTSDPGMPFGVVMLHARWEVAHIAKTY